MATEFSDETQFGQSLVDRQLITPEELRKCMHKQREYERAGKRISLPDVMLEQGCITKT